MKNKKVWTSSGNFIIPELSLVELQDRTNRFFSTQVSNPMGDKLVAESHHKTGPLSFEVTNLVTTSRNLAEELDLGYIATCLEMSSFNPAVFPGLSLRFREEHQGVKATVTIFRSGKVNCTGTENFKKVILAFYALTTIFDRIGVPYNPEYTISPSNYVTVCYFPHMLRISDMYNDFEDNVSYSPERFPGMGYKIGGTKFSALIFYTGRIVTTGTIDFNEIYMGIEDIKRNILQEKYLIY